MMNIHKIKQVPSTNQYLKDHIDTYNHFDVLITENQTEGKGRRGNIWFSDHDSLAFSILLKHIKRSSHIDLLGLFVAKIIHEVIMQYSNDVRIKWPNDIIVNDQKLSGILVETINLRNTSHVIIGIGINVNQSTFPDELNHKTTSVKQISNQHIDKDSLLDGVLKQFEHQYHQFISNPSDIITYCNQHLAYKHELITFMNQQRTIQGQCLSISPQGHLNIRIQGNIESFPTGEIHHIRHE